MRKAIFITVLMISLITNGYTQTMTFDAGAAETGFSFAGWNAASGTIWVANLATTATITKNTGTWNVVSFYVGPYVGANIMQVQDNLGHTYSYNSATTGTHTLNWTGITSLTFSRVSGSGASADIDNIVYSTCKDPTVPTVTHSPATICNGSTSTLTISGTLNDATSWKIYSGSCGGTLVGSTASSTYVVTPSFPSTTYYVRGEGGCVAPGGCTNHTITVTASQSAAFNYSSSAYCQNVSDPTPTITGVTGGTFSSSPAGLSLNTTTGAIDVSASSTGGYTVTYTTPGPCAGSANASININAVQNASFNYSLASYCSNGSDPVPTITGVTGGTFSSSPAGLSINTTSGQIDVSASTARNYTVTYTTPGTCPGTANTSINIVAADNASFNYSSSAYCINGIDPSPVITGLAGGSFSSSPGGLSLNTSTGNVDLSASSAGAYNITYTTIGSCPNTHSVSFSVNTLDNASFNYSSPAYCSNGSDPSPIITGMTGGTFSSSPAGISISAATGIIDVSASTAGPYVVTYTTAGACSNFSNIGVSINNADNPSFSYPNSSYCGNGVDPSPTITGLSGGSFSSTAGISINPVSGLIDLSACTEGPYTITYTTNGACPNSLGVPVSVTAIDNASFNYVNISYCSNGSDPTPTITGLSGGSFSSTAGISLNTTSGTIDLSASTAGPYVVTYTTNGSCPNSSIFLMSIVLADDASFNYTGSSYCTNGTDPSPAITGLAGGTFSSTAGITISPSSGSIDLSASTAGPYNITYTTNGSCPNYTIIAMNIVTADDASFNYSSSSYCGNGVDPTPTITGLNGGSFSSTAGLTINPTTGNIDLSLSAPGPYNITYSTNGSCPNTSDASVTITAVDDASFSYYNSSYCGNGIDPSPIITGLGGGGFNSTAGLSLNAVNGNIDLSTCTAGSYIVTYSTIGTCPNSTNQPIDIFITDTSVVMINATMTANLSGATYQWLNCSSMLPVDFETNQSFTPSENGTYAVVVSKDGCSDTSSCFSIVSVNINNFESNFEVKIHPNPTKGNLNIDLGQFYDIVTVKLTNMIGQVVLTSSEKAVSNIQLNIPGNSGVYMVEISLNGAPAIIRRIVKE